MKYKVTLPDGTLLFLVEPVEGAPAPAPVPVPPEEPEKPPVEEPPVEQPENPADGAPARVTQVRMTGAEQDSISLAWNRQSGNEAGFRIHSCRDVCSFGSSKIIGTVEPGVTEFVAQGLAPGTAYRFWVVAFNAAGAAERSHTQTFWTLDVEGPGEPDEPEPDEPDEEPEGPLPEPPPLPPPTGGDNQYFDELAADPRAVILYPFRSDAELASYPKGKRSSPPNIPLFYDPEMDAMCQMIDTTGDDPRGGSTGPMQVKPLTRLRGVHNLFAAWDCRWDSGYIHQSDGPDDFGTLDQHKYGKWLDDVGTSGQLWLSWKINYVRGAWLDRKNNVKRDPQMAGELFFTVSNQFVVEGESWKGSSERLMPAANQVLLPVDRWCAIYLHYEGLIAEGEIGRLSVWAGPVGEPPVVMLDRVAFKSPAELKTFMHHFDSSTKTDRITKTQRAKAWNRNTAMLKDVSYSEALALVSKRNT